MVIDLCVSQWSVQIFLLLWQCFSLCGHHADRQAKCIDQNWECSGINSSLYNCSQETGVTGILKVCLILFYSSQGLSNFSICEVLSLCFPTFRPLVFLMIHENAIIERWYNVDVTKRCYSLLVPTLGSVLWLNSPRLICKQEICVIFSYEDSIFGLSMV